MSLSKELLHRYVAETGGIDLDDESLARLAVAAATATAAVNTVASDSLFDTEPEQLHTLLDELAGASGA